MTDPDEDYPSQMMVTIHDSQVTVDDLVRDFASSLNKEVTLQVFPIAERLYTVVLTSRMARTALEACTSLVNSLPETARVKYFSALHRRDAPMASVYVQPGLIRRLAESKCDLNWFYVDRSSNSIAPIGSRPHRTWASLSFDCTQCTPELITQTFGAEPQFYEPDKNNKFTRCDYDIESKRKDLGYGLDELAGYFENFVNVISADDAPWEAYFRLGCFPIDPEPPFNRLVKIKWTTLQRLAVFGIPLDLCCYG